MRKSTPALLSFTLTTFLAGAVAQAAELVPTFAGAPTGWTVDRYAPNSFSDIGTYQGLTHVLGIGISSADALNNRPPAYQSTFYNTQGESQAVSGGIGSTLSAQLYIPTSWGDPASGSIRTDLWGVATDGSSVVDYPIIGFTNYGGPATLRYWDENLNGGLGAWVNLVNAINYDAWNSLSIEFTGSAFEYFVNGLPAATDSSFNGATGFSAVILQAYNFGGDPSITGAIPVDYTAHWANIDAAAASVPEPLTLSLFGAGVAGMVAMRRRKSGKA